ncbi:hypothetical protein T492DRAFT_1059054 [Pavlovales sp. CCMP2436]|nr:hypothetical protein T492DRAFT_1059054 [Pavlovales sp. CCMP2436]
MAALVTLACLGFARPLLMRPTGPALNRLALGMRVALPRAAPVASALDAAVLAATEGPSALLAFADQGQNLAGICFQASLVPYLAFLYFLGDKRNGTPPLVFFGFQFLLLFVLATIPTGLISKSVYAEPLADADWLHGGAELLLTVTNLLVLTGLRSANAGDVRQNDALRVGALGLFAVLCATCYAGLNVLHLGPHAPFLLGAGALSPELLASAALHAEPENALSIPTWAVHSSSVLEWVLCMGAMWQWAETVGNPKWKGLVWAMLPLHASGIAACTYHFFYNAPDLKPLVTAQAGLTLVGNTALAVAAARVAWSNGWRPADLNPLGAKAEFAPSELLGAIPTTPTAEGFFALKVALSSGAAAYAVKYGSLALALPFSPSLPVAAAIVAAPPAVLAYAYVNRGASDAQLVVEMAGNGGGPVMSEAGGEPPEPPEEGKPSLPSMADIKKYGVSGTVAYALTELIFWLVSLPVASLVYLNTAGHWPDFSDNTDRAAVLAYVFAGVNLARLVVPLRLGVALAAAPWVDANIISKFGSKMDEQPGE